MDAFFLLLLFFFVACLFLSFPGSFQFSFLAENPQDKLDTVLPASVEADMEAFQQAEQEETHSSSPNAAWELEKRAHPTTSGGHAV